MKKILLALLPLLAGHWLPAQETEENEAHEMMLRQMSDTREGRSQEEMQAYRNSHPQTLAANWTYINASGSAYGDVGRTNSITLDTLNPGRFYVCTPHSGVWLTNNNGASYTPITEALPTQSVSRLVIDPSNTNVLYIATGIHNGDMLPNSFGIFKSTDGGATWNATGLSFQPSAGVAIGDLLINPQNHSSLVAATTDGLYRTYNGGVSWTRLVNDTFASVRYKPGDTATMYAVGKRFYRTDDAWASWAMTTSTFVDNYTWKYEYAVRVSAVTPGLVYLLTDGNSIGPGIRSYIHVSTDGGWSFNVIDSVQGQPQMQFDVSQRTPGKYMAGYYSVFKRENSSGAMQQITYNYTNQSPYVHSDQRGIFFDPQNDNVLYLCNDGGLYRSTDNGVSFQNITGNMQLGHIYNFGQSQSTPYKIVTAPLDVSPFQIGSSGITRTYPLVEAFIADMSPLNDSVYVFAHFTPYFTHDDWTTYGASSNVLCNNMPNFPKAFQYSELAENENYFGDQNEVFKSTDYGQSHPLEISCTYTSQWMYELDVSRANPQYHYLRFKDSLLVTTDGVTFTNISAGLPSNMQKAASVTIDPQNAANVWVTFGGYTAADKVYFTNNAGQTWINFSSGIPNVPVNELVCQRGGPPGAVYAATDGGVFYRDSTFNSWQFYNTGLPAGLIITDLDIQYSIGKLRAATYGRGMWESDLYAPSGITEPANEVSAITLFPNPAQNEVEIHSENGTLGTIAILDMTGRVVQQTTADAASFRIDLSGLAAGVYFVRVQDSVFRLVKD